MGEEFLRVLLPHRRKLFMSLPNQRFEARRLYTGLEHRRRRRVLECLACGIVRRSGVRRVGVPPAEEPIRNLTHLTFYTIRREGNRTRFGVTGP